MKRIHIFLLTCCLCISTFASERTIIADSQINKVSLFQDAALVHRTALVDLPIGKSLISFSNLPSVADQNALRANLADNSQGVIRNAKLYTPRDIDEPEAVLTLEIAIIDLQNKIKSIQQSKAIAQKEHTFASQLSISFAKQFGEMSEGQSLSLEQAKDTLAYAHQTMVEANAKMAAHDQEISDTEEQIQDLTKELREKREYHAKLSSIAEIEVEITTPGQVQVEISYIVRNANWYPRYELRAQPDQNEIEFGYFATIYQSTGEDWTNVQLSLHTNQANRNGDQPELHPLRVNKLENRGYASDKLRSRGPQESMAYKQEVLMGAAPVPPAPPPSAQISSSSTSFQIQLPGTPTIASTNESTTLPITKKTFASEFWTEIVPRMRLESFLIGKTTNTLDLPILPGQALAFVDGKLSSKVHLPKTLPEEEIKLSLGIDANVTVKRKEGSSKDASTGFIDKTTTLKREYSNIVSNYHSVAHKVVVADQFPISQNSKIEIRRTSPEDSEVVFEDEDSELGIFEWTATLGAKESKTFTTSYNVIYPRDWTIQPDL